MFSPITIALLILALYLISSIKILAEYERGVIFRLGRALPSVKGPGLILVFAPIDRLVRMSLRVETLDVPAQDIVTRDNVTAKVNAVIVLPRSRTPKGSARGSQLSLRNIATGTDNAPECARRSRTG